ncbi:hypothetical protein [Paenibacillus sp. y28]
MNKTWIILVVSIIVVFLLPGYWIVNWVQSDQRNPEAQSGLMDLRG